VVVLAEAKRGVGMLKTLRLRVHDRYRDSPPDMTPGKDEARQLAWRLWTVKPDYTWLIGPGHRAAFRTTTSPLCLEPTNDSRLPPASELGLETRPPVAIMPPPTLLT
jgi:hypothetical protein